MTADLFDDQLTEAAQLAISPGAVLLRGFAREVDAALLQAFDDVTAQAPLRHLVTPGGYTMSVAMSNCGPLGWVSDRSGYRYAPQDPLSGRPWPAMPACWLDLATRAAAQAGFAGFRPDACLVNLYEPGSKLSLHQDRDEAGFAAPIVSVSLGVPAVFLFGTPRRKDRRGSAMATWSYGAGRHGWLTMGLRHWRTASMHCSGAAASTSLFGRRADFQAKRVAGRLRMCAGSYQKRSRWNPGWLPARRCR